MAEIFTALFVVFLVLMTGLKLWLAGRQVRHVSRHAGRVPAQFEQLISLESHQRAARYTIVKQRLAMLQFGTSVLTLVALTLLGGLGWIAQQLQGLAGTGLLFQVLVVTAVVAVTGIVDLPFEWYRQFKVEQAFGFNRMTARLFVLDTVKSVLLSTLIGVPVLALVLWLMSESGPWWWLYAWLVWLGFSLLILILYPVFIAPLFNRFEPLRDRLLEERIQALLTRTGFSSSGVFVMDGSRRSAHGNAYFTGLGRAKRIVFFDTLVERLAPSEIEAVLAHELGHYKLRHVTKRLAWSFALALAMLALLGWLSQQLWFYQGLGVEPLLAGRNDGLALALFMLVLPVFTFALAPLASLLSRRHEFEADSFAAHHVSARELVSALVKLYQDNAATLTPDPLHSAFYDSHPPAALRIERLAAQAA